MSVYLGKLLELLSIETKSDKAYLKVRLSYDDEIELLWEIDNDIADQLKTIAVFEENYKYRLSFFSSWDPVKKKYISYLTKTYRDQSEKIYFACSKAYTDQLASLKNSNQKSELSSLSFISSNLEKKEIQIEKLSTSKSNIGWLSVALISIISTITIGYVSHSCINQDLFCEKKPAKAESVSKIESVQITKNETSKQTVNSTKKMELIVQPTIQSVKLNKVINFSIPKGTVALTFDDGPSKYSVRIMKILKEYHAGGTFFYIGQNVKKYPNNVKYAHSNGFSIGSHSMNHIDFTKLTYKKQENEIIQTNKLIQDLTHQNVTLFRPPYGSKNKQTIELMQKYHFKMVLWNRDTEDWKYRNSKEIINYVQKSKESGAIILLHESQATLDSLPTILTFLQSKNLRVVSLY